jgi:EmrB/QacA subfamily drug resistance transporter
VPYQRRVLLTALTGMFATTFPVTILTVSLGEIADELGSSETTLAWVISAPLLASALALPVLGKMGDLHGHRRVFLIGFAAASVLAGCTALAWSAASLITIRTLAQVTGAATQPTSMALIMSVYGREERVKALGWWSLVAAGSPALGLAVGGPLVDAFGWQLLFVIQAALGAVAVAVGALVLRESTERSTDVRFDVAGAATLALGAGAMMFAFNQAPVRGFSDPFVIGAALLAPLGITAFVHAERRADAPLLPLEFLERRNFRSPLIASVFQGAAYMGGFVLAPLLVDNVFGYSVSAISLLMLIRPLVFSASSPIGGSLATRIGERPVAVFGAAAVTGALLLFALGARTESIALIVAGLALQGVGNGTAQPPLNATLANSVDEHNLGIASAAQRMAFQIGSSMGITVLTAVYGGDGEASSFSRAYVVGALLGGCAVLAASAIRSTPRGRTDPASAVELSSTVVNPGQ